MEDPTQQTCTYKTFRRKRQHKDLKNYLKNKVVELKGLLRNENDRVMELEREIQRLRRVNDALSKEVVDLLKELNVKGNMS